MFTKSSKVWVLLLLFLQLVVVGCGAGNSTPTIGSTSANITPTTSSASNQNSQNTSSNLKQVTLALGYIPTVQFAPYYVAQEKGFYKEEGLSVKFNHGIVSDLIKMVGTGKIPYGVASGDEVLVARSHGVPVVYLGAYFQKYPVVLITRSEDHITDIKQLKGKVIGVPGQFGATYTGLLALLHSANMNERDVKIRSIGFTQVQALERKQVDAVMGYASNEPIQLRHLGVKVNTIPVWEHLNLVSNGLITSQDKLSSDPQEAAAVVRATMKGLQYTIDHPEEAFQISLKYVPEAAQDKEIQMEVLKSSIELWQSQATKEHGLGYTDPNMWKTTLDFLKSIGLIKHDVDLSKAYTNQFVEKSR